MFHPLLIALTLAAPAAHEPFRYPANQAHGGRLELVQGVPVLFLAGTPEQMGRQTAALAVTPAKRLLGYPRDCLNAELGLLGATVRDLAWAKALEKGKPLLATFPANQRAEYDGLLAAGAPADQLLAANTLFDLKNIGPALFGCSSVVVPPSGSATKGTLFGRNLDFRPLGYLHEYGLVTVRRGVGKRPFVSIGYPGVVGCFSGMNDAGFCIASHEVFTPTKDRTFDPKGLPFAVCYRQLLEECATVAEAEALLRKLPRATTTLLVLADPAGGAVLEVTPDRVVRRPASPGVCACSNHFTTDGLAVSRQANAYQTVDRLKQLAAPADGPVGVAEVKRRLHAASQKELTIQTMVFEPAARRIHLSMGKGPVTANEMVVLEAGAWLARE